MENGIESIEFKIDRASSATEKFIRDYSEKMRHPVSQLVSVIDSPQNDSLINERDLESLQRLIRDIDQVLNGLLDDLQRDHYAN